MPLKAFLIDERMTNVIFETSTVRDSATVARAVAIVGEDRIVFGSDYPFNSHEEVDPMAEEINVIERATISAQARQKVLARNIQTYLGV